MTTIALEAPTPVTSQTWAGHWHGFGPWIGAPAQYAQEGSRRPAHPVRPGPDAAFAHRYKEAGDEFTASGLPPLMTGHWLAKSGQAAAARTWTDVEQALEWLTQQYTVHPPFERTDGGQAYISLDGKVAYAGDVLPRGVDVSWVHYTQSRSLFSASVVCCPNLHHLDLDCPLLPRY
ncbi:hypothetical protein [Streptomyces sp. NPDC001635]